MLQTDLVAGPATMERIAPIFVAGLLWAQELPDERTKAAKGSNSYPGNKRPGMMEFQPFGAHYLL